MKVKELISILQKLEPELDVYTFYDHGVIYALDREQVILVDEHSEDKYTPRGVMFCSHHDDDMDFLVAKRKYKKVD